MVKIRKARGTDRHDITNLIAVNFARDFAALSKKAETIAISLLNGINTERFIVAELDDRVVGILAVSDKAGRAIVAAKQDCVTAFGYIKGAFVKFIYDKELSPHITYPLSTAYLEFIAVDAGARRMGIATKMIDFVVDNYNYSRLKLDVYDSRAYALKCYERYGFKVVDTKKDPLGKFKGLNEKFYMEYEIPTMAESKYAPPC